MSLSKPIELTVYDNYKIKMSNLIELYRNDSLLLRFTLSEYEVEFFDGIKYRNLVPLEPLNAYIVIERPDDEFSDMLKATTVTGNEIQFYLGEEWTKYTGIGRMQIILVDNDTCQITLPEIKYEVRDNILQTY